MRSVIIGNSAAAVGAIEAIRRCGNREPITVVAEEPHRVYSRPLISYLLGGMVDEEYLYYRPAGFYEHHGVETMLGTQVERVNPRNKTVLLAGGGTLDYGQLLIATGGRPFVPPVSGVGLDGVFTLSRWEDALRIGRYIDRQGAKSAIVVGGGLIGLKTTEALLAHSLSVTVVELADRMLSATFDRTASELVENILRRNGVEIRKGTTVKEVVARDGRADHALLLHGERLDCDLVVFAIGVRPNVDLVRPEAEVGITLNRGILVDRQMRTSAPSVFAAGDCAEGYDMLLEGNRPIAIWPNAYRQGYVAGCNMAGVSREFAGGIAMNSVEVCGVPTISVGITDPQEDQSRYEVVEEYRRDAGSYRRLVLHANRLVGAVFVGDIDRAGIYTGLIRDRANVGPFKTHLLSGSFGLISLPQEHRKHLVVGDGIEV